MGCSLLEKKKEFEFIVPTKSDDSLSVLQMRSLMLKLPIISFFSGESFSNNKDIKLSTTLRIDTLHVYVYSLLLVVCNHLLPPAMGIRKKIRRQFYFYFCRRKGQIRRHYNGKNWELWKLWKLSEVVIIILFSAIILFLYMFIHFLLVF